MPLRFIVSDKITAYPMAPWRTNASPAVAFCTPRRPAVGSIVFAMGSVTMLCVAAAEVEIRSRCAPRWTGVASMIWRQSSSLGQSEEVDENDEEEPPSLL